MPRSSTTEQLGLLRSRLEGNISGNIKLVQGLVSTFETEPNMLPARFEDLASRIFREDNQLRSLAIAPDLVVSRVFPGLSQIFVVNVLLTTTVEIPLPM